MVDPRDPRERRRCSIQLSYGRISLRLSVYLVLPRFRAVIVTNRPVLRDRRLRHEGRPHCSLGRLNSARSDTRQSDGRLTDRGDQTVLQ